jgi:hypothetical protein
MTGELDSAVLRALASDAGAFMQQMDLVQRRALFVRITQAQLRAASFLDERLGMQGREGFWIPLDNLAEIASAGARPLALPDCIFHIGHCGSTLLSRLLDLDESILGLREPLVLRELAAAERDLETPMARISSAHWRGLFADSLAILGRRFQTGQRIIVKATSTCNNLIEPWLALDRQVRAVLLYLPLESYLATTLKAPGGGLDALHAAPARLGFLHRLLDCDTLRLHHLDAAETVAMGWIAELGRFLQLEAAQGETKRVVMLDFEKLLEDPGRRLDEVRRQFGLPARAIDNGSLLQSPVMRGYAKSPSHAYSPADRRHDLALSRKKFAGEIGRGMSWAEMLLKNQPKLAPLAALLR